MAILTFLRNSVISIPVVTFLIAIAINNYYLLLLPIGITISAIINIILKSCASLFSHRIFRRPIGSKGCGAGCGNSCYTNTEGFPSGHSQNAWFFSAFMILYNSKFGNNSILVKILYLVFASIISFSRLGYNSSLGTTCHTPLQVLVGSILGTLLGAIYFSIINMYIGNKNR